MKSVRYECDYCGGVTKVRYQLFDLPPVRIRCTKCVTDDGMVARMPRPANHFHPAKRTK